jgi:hypothetical protein
MNAKGLHHPNTYPSISQTNIHLHTQNERGLVVLADKIIRQLLDGRCRVPSYHIFVVVCDENGLRSLDDDNTFSFLFEDESVLHLFIKEDGGACLSGIKTSVLSLGKNISYACNVNTICPQRIRVFEAGDDLLQLSRGHLSTVRIQLSILDHTIAWLL